MATYTGIFDAVWQSGLLFISCVFEMVKLGAKIPHDTTPK